MSDQDLKINEESELTSSHQAAAIHQSLDTFEASTADASTPASELLAEYANPISCDSVFVAPVVDVEPVAPAETAPEQLVETEPAATEVVDDDPMAVTEVPVAETPVAEVPVAEVPAAEVNPKDAAAEPVQTDEFGIPLTPRQIKRKAKKQAKREARAEAARLEAERQRAAGELPSDHQVQAADRSAEFVASKPAAGATGQMPAAAKPVATPADQVVPAQSKPAVDNRPRFADLPLAPQVQQAIDKSGYEYPTDIQSEIIPHMLDGRDVLAQSQTGSGKTAAFALPILSQIEPATRRPQVLVLAPTRELAIQVSKSFTTYASCLPGFNVVAVYGGQDYEPQLRQLRRGVQVVVGTPGRIIDHIKRGTLDLSDLKTLVLDEADEMLNMGFLEDVEFVLEQTPPGRQVALFSATLPGPIQRIAETYLADPVTIKIKQKTLTADSIRQRALFVSPRDKVDVLKRIIEAEETDGVIVFTKTKDATVSVAEQLGREGLSAVALNGDMPQKVRERAIHQLKSAKLDILVATDVAARGLDVQRVSHVFNFDLPHDTESYIHRIGRTGRAGRSGEAVIFLTNAQRGKLRMIERATKQTIEVVQAPTAKDINARRIQQFKDQITEITAGQDLTFFKDLIAEYAKESGKPIELIAAAIAQAGQNGRSFLMKDRPAPKKRDNAERFERRPHDRFEDGGDDRGQRDRRFGPPEPGMRRYRIEVGWRDGIKPGNIVGAVANEAGIEGRNIGQINIKDSFSLIDLPDGMPSDIFQTLQTTRVGGRELQISEDNGPRGGGEGGGYRGGGNRRRPGGGHGGGGHGGPRSFHKSKGKPKPRKRK